MSRRLSRKSARLAITVTAAIGVLAGAFTAGIAIAGHNVTHVSFSGKGLVATRIVTDQQDQEFVGQTFKPLAGSGVDVGVPSGGTRLASSTFIGQSSCTNATAFGTCAVRVVARKHGTTTPVEFYPQAGRDAFFDTVAEGDDYWETNALGRTKTLTSGTWRIWVEVATANSTTHAFLDSWHHRVDVFAR